MTALHMQEKQTKVLLRNQENANAADWLDDVGPAKPTTCMANCQTFCSIPRHLLLYPSSSNAPDQSQPHIHAPL